MWCGRIIKAKGEMTLGPAWCFQEVSPPEPRGGNRSAGPETLTLERERRQHHTENWLLELLLSPCSPLVFQFFLSYIKTPSGISFSRKKKSIKQMKTQASKGSRVQAQSAVRERGLLCIGPRHPALYFFWKCGRVGWVRFTVC